MSWYNVTGIDGTNLLTMAQTINEQLMQNQLGILILIVIFAVSYISFMYFNDNPKFNLTVSFFGVGIFSILFRLLNLVPDVVPFFCWGFFALFLAVLVFSQ